MDVEHFLAMNGPCLSSKVKEQLLSEGMTDEAARKMMSRLGGEICHLNSIKFPKRESFLFLRSQYKTDEFYNSLYEAFKKTSSVYACLISTLIALGGATDLEKLRVISGCPVKKTKKKLFENLVSELQSIGLINVENEMFILTENFHFQSRGITDYHSCEYLNVLFQNLFTTWLKKNSLVSYNTIKPYGEFCSFYWDLTGASYLLPLVSRDQPPKGGFIVVDFIPQYDINEAEVDFFIRKVQSCSSNRKNRPFIPILIGNSFTLESLRLLREKNILVSTPANFFGEHIDILLHQIITILETSNTITNLNSTDNIGVILESLAKIEGETNNLRGHFFELIAGNIINSTSPGTITLNKKIKCADNRKAEIDVINITTDHIYIFECKGHKKDRLISSTDIETWGKKISIIYDWLKEYSDYSSKDVTFTYWTTSSFHDDAVTLIKEKKHNTKKYSIETMNCKELFEYSKTKKLTHVCELLRVHFM